MAGDWIQMRCDLADDPAVIEMAAAVNLEEDYIVGKLHRLWSWADRQVQNGNVTGVTAEWIDRYLSVPGFAAAMVSAGWLVVESNSVTFPKFDRYFSQSAKQRALTALRVAKHRAKPCNDSDVTKTLPEKKTVEKKTKEKKTEEKKKTTPSASDGDSPLMATEAELVQLWGTTEGVRDIRTDELSDARRRQLVTRLKSKTWWDDAKEALGHFPLKCFEGEDNWRPTLDWFLKPDNVAKILEGKYDWQKGSSDDRGKTKPGPGQRHPNDAGRTTF